MICLSSMGRLVFLIFLLSSVAAWSAPHQKVTGIFSNMHYIEESGDVLGVEISLIYSNAGYFALIQCAEGAPSKPVLVSAVVNGSVVQLAAHDDQASQCPMAPFTGELTSTGLRGTFEGSDYPGLLKRKKSFWQ